MTGEIGWASAMILLFFLCFPPIFSIPLCSTISITLRSTTNPQSTDFSVFHWLPSFSALLCWQMWPHGTHEKYPTYDAYWHYWNTFLPVHIPWYHTTWVSYVVYIDTRWGVCPHSMSRSYRCISCVPCLKIDLQMFCLLELKYSYSFYYLDLKPVWIHFLALISWLPPLALQGQPAEAKVAEP